MRALFLVPMTFVPLALFHALWGVTGDPLCAILLELVLLITLGGWVASRPIAAGASPSRRSAFDHS